RQAAPRWRPARGACGAARAVPPRARPGPRSPGWLPFCSLLAGSPDELVMDTGLGEELLRVAGFLRDPGFVLVLAVHRGHPGSQVGFVGGLLRELEQRRGPGGHRFRAGPVADGQEPAGEVQDLGAALRAEDGGPGFGCGSHRISSGQLADRGWPAAVAAVAAAASALVPSRCRSARFAEPAP